MGAGVVLTVFSDIVCRSVGATGREAAAIMRAQLSFRIAVCGTGLLWESSGGELSVPME